MPGLCAAALLASCAKKDADGAKMADSTTAVSAMPPAAPALTNEIILGKLHFDNVQDSTAGSMAVTKGTDASVKEFGRMMVKDHHAMHLDVMAAQTKAGLTPDTTMDAGAVAEKAAGDSMMTAPKGAAWDKMYIDHAIEGHTKVLQFAQDAANATQNADVKAVIVKGAPIVQKHLDKAKEIQGKLASAKP